MLLIQWFSSTPLILEKFLLKYNVTFKLEIYQLAGNSPLLIRNTNFHRAVAKLILITACDVSFFTNAKKFLYIFYVFNCLLKNTFIEMNFPVSKTLEHP